MQLHRQTVAAAVQQQLDVTEVVLLKMMVVLRALQQQQLPSTQLAAAQRLAAASCIAFGAQPSNPSFDTFYHNRCAAGTPRICSSRLISCSKRKPCVSKVALDQFSAFGRQRVW